MKKLNSVQPSQKCSAEVGQQFHVHPAQSIINIFMFDYALEDL